MPAVARSRVEGVVKENKDIAKGNVAEDRRNLGLKKEGLLNEKEWIHLKPILTKIELE